MVPQTTRIRELSEALRQNPDLKAVFEFGSSQAKRDARLILRELGVTNIRTREAQ